MELSGGRLETLKPLKLFWDSLLESAKLLILVTSSQCLWASNNGHLDCLSAKIDQSGGFLPRFFHFIQFTPD